MKKKKALLILIGIFIVSITLFMLFPNQKNFLTNKLYKFTNSTLNMEILIPIKYTEKNDGSNKINAVNLYHTEIFCDKITTSKSDMNESVHVQIKFEYKVKLFNGAFISLHEVNDHMNYRGVSSYPLKFQIINTDGKNIPYTQYGIDGNTDFVITFDKKVFPQENNEIFVKFTNLNLLSYRLKDLKEIFLNQH